MWQGLFPGPCEVLPWPVRVVLLQVQTLTSEMLRVKSVARDPKGSQRLAGSFVRI